MGYTHYFPRAMEIEEDRFLQFARACAKIIHNADAEVCFEFNEVSLPPQITPDMVRFNGIGDDGHETFYFPRVVTDDEAGYQTEDYRARWGGKLFTFCKTARKDYDTIVTACLFAALYYLPEEVDVSSDGDTEDWREGRKLFEEATGLKAPSLNFEEVS